MSRQNSESNSSKAPEDSMSGRVWDLSQRSRGCRYVQAQLELAGEEEAQKLAHELRGRVGCASRGSCTNYVLQKFIQVLRPQACQFIIDELLEVPGEVMSLARHQYGCRILQRLLENCQGKQMEGVVALLLAEALPLVRHGYATFVMQAIFDYGDETQRFRLGEVMMGSLGALGNDENATQVLNKALQQAPQRQQLARAMVPQLAHIARGRHSHQSVLAALQLLPADDLKRATAHLAQKVQKLWASRYGRLVVKAIPALYQQCNGMTRREAMGQA